MEKLKTLIQRFQAKQLNTKIIREMLDHELLRGYLPQIFPSENQLPGILDATKLIKSADVQKMPSVINIPYNLTDDNWMKEYIKHFLKFNINYQKSKNKVKDENIASFVKTDPEYDSERNRFGNDIVRCNIRDIINESKQKPWLRSDKILQCELVHRLLKYHLPNPVVQNGIKNNLDLIYEPDMEKI